MNAKCSKLVNTKWSKCTQLKLFHKAPSARSRGCSDTSNIFPLRVPRISWHGVSGRLLRGHQRGKKSGLKRSHCGFRNGSCKNQRPDSSPPFTDFRVRGLSVEHGAWRPGSAEWRVSQTLPLRRERRGEPPPDIESCLTSWTTWLRHRLAPPKVDRSVIWGC